MRKFVFIQKTKTLFLLFKKAYASCRFQILALAAIGLVGGLLEGIGVNALIPFFSFVTGQQFAGTSFISTLIENAFRYLRIDFSIKYLLIFIVALFTMKAVLVFWGKYMQNFISLNYGKRLSMILLHDTLEAEWKYLLNQRVGYLSTILLTESRAVAVLLSTISEVTLTMMTLAVYVFMAFLLSWQATAATFGLGLVLVIMSKPFIDRARKVMQEKVDEAKESVHFIDEITLGAKTIKASSIAPSVLRRAYFFFENFRKRKLRYFIYRGALGSAIQPISVIFISGLFVFLYKASYFNLGSFIALVYLIQRIFSYINQIDSDIHKINEGIPYLRSVIKYRENTRNHQEKDMGTKQFVFNNKLQMRDVSFAYGTGDDLLRGVSFSLKKGESLGVIGPSGSGKTTFVDIILRLFTPRNGAFFLDGEKAENISLKEWRANVGYVSQDIHLINDTIANNISFYAPLTEGEIERAAEDANIREFIKSLSRGFETVIGERGIKLSMGQRQRIIIARALARNPKLLIFDEATSALDNESELRIQETIENLRGKVTMIVVAHRLETVLNCDTILVLKEGRVIENGPPRSLLLDEDSYFFKMYNIRR